MSRSEDFLSRWSRRKQQAAKESSLPAKEPEPTAAQEKAAAEPQLSATADTPQPEPLFDLSKLPSLDSIGPNTDVSIFMQPGVPASLARAALRRAWSADPAIRDFIGLSENSWDFTKPETISGFGQLLPIDDVKRLLAQVLKDDEPTSSDAEQTAPQQEAVGASAEQSASQEPEIEGISFAPEPELAVEPDSVVRCTSFDPAPQERPADDASPAGSRRRHGGALPG